MTDLPAVTTYIRPFHHVGMQGGLGPDAASLKKKKGALSPVSLRIDVIRTATSSTLFRDCYNTRLSVNFLLRFNRAETEVSITWINFHLFLTHILKPILGYSHTFTQTHRIHQPVSLHASSRNIADIVESIKSKKASVSEVVKDSLGQIHRQDKEIGAFLAISGDKALAAAKALDEKLAGKDAKVMNLPLLGLPVAIKDNICTSGKRDLSLVSLVSQPYED